VKAKGLRRLTDLPLGANRAVCRWGLGDMSQVHEQPFHRIIHPGCDDPACYLYLMWQRLASDSKGVEQVEQEFGDAVLDRWLSVSFEKIKPPENEALAQLTQPFAMLEFRDVTKLRQRREMERRRTRFEAFNFALRGLVHEIGNPLAAMRASIEVLRDNLENFPVEKTVAYLERVLEGTMRLQSIVDQNAQVAKVRDLHVTRIPLRHIFERMQRLFEDEFRAQGIHFKVNSPLSPDYPQIILDLTAIEEVIVNIVKNAREASKPGDTVSLSYRIYQSCLAIVIEDEGKGMDRHDLTTLFIPMLSTKPNGLGLGLSYSNYLVQQMGGHLKVQSKPGRGTKISLHFKLSHEAAVPVRKRTG